MINELLGGKRLAHMRRLQDESGRQKTLKPAVSEKWWAPISQSQKKLHRWPARTAPLLDVRQTFERYLCRHNPLSPQNWLADASS